jgi:hypothetical protein
MTVMADNTMVPNEPMLRYVRMAVFPNSRLWGYSRDGSAGEPPDTHNEIQVMYCPVCREAELSWWRYQWQQAHLRGER